MQPKSLRVSFTIQAGNVEEAIADLGHHFLHSTKTGCKVVRQPTEFKMSELCNALIEDWQSGKVAYGNGVITLIFSAGELDSAADLLVYRPKQGDRFLYSKRPTPAPDFPEHPQQLPIQGIAADLSIPISGEIVYYLTQSLRTTTEAFAELAANQRAIEHRMASLVMDSTVLEHKLQEQTAAFSQHLKTALEAQSSSFAQILANQITATALHFSERLDTLQAHLNKLASQLQEMEKSKSPKETQAPKTEAEWLNRIRSTWGTVGDYEQYSDNHREINAEKPLYSTPDWIALCELEWARKLCPTLAVLYDLIYSEDGIGYEGANILHQFGKHIDPQTGEHYYIYHRSGFTAYEALWQTIRNSQTSWLQELQSITAKVTKRHPDIFQMFGWEQEAIASLESIMERAYREQQSAHNPRTYPHGKSGDTLSDDLAILNLGPFSPITIESIRRAYRQAMKTAHPDAGGSKEHAQRVNEAYEAVLRHYFPEAP
jgi:enamine deaminase RidA (YjgF/YER057c/UK114 family)